jgi:hypothetical protein
MTVKELIKLLCKMPQDAEVNIPDWKYVDEECLRVPDPVTCDDGRVEL